MVNIKKHLQHWIDLAENKENLNKIKNLYQWLKSRFPL